MLQLEPKLMSTKGKVVRALSTNDTLRRTAVQCQLKK
jgi:hypothetical protein